MHVHGSEQSNRCWRESGDIVSTRDIDSASRTHWHTLSLVSGVAGALINGYFNRDIQRVESEAVLETEQVKGDAALDLERLKFETGLILKALNTTEQPDAVKRLKFFAKAGLIPRYEKRVLTLAEEAQGAAVPTITLEKGQGVPVEPISSRYLELSQAIVRLEHNDSGPCAGVLLRPWHVLTSGICGTGTDDDSTITARIGSAPGTLIPVSKIFKPSGQDFAVLTLDGAPGKDLEFLDLAKVRDPRQGEALFIIHPYAEGDLVVSQAGCIAGPLMGTDFAYKCPTAFGTAGAIIFSTKDLAPLGMVDRFGIDQTFTDIGIRLSPLVPKITSAMSGDPATSNLP